MSESKVVRVKVETVTPQQRTIFLLLMGIGIILLGMIGIAYGVLEAVVGVLVIAGFHLAMNWKDPSAGAAARPSRMAGTLAQVQADAPFMTLLISRQSRVFELAKGLAKGVLFLLAKTVFFHGYTILLTPISLMEHSLPWAAVAVLLISAGCAWHWEGVMTAIRPLLKLRPAHAEDTLASSVSKDS